MWRPEQVINNNTDNMLYKIFRGLSHVDYYIYKLIEKNRERRRFMVDFFIHLPLFFFRGELKKRFKLQEKKNKPIHIVLTSPAMDKTLHLLDEVEGDVFLVNGAMSIKSLSRYEVKYIVALDESCLYTKWFLGFYEYWLKKENVTLIAEDTAITKSSLRNKENIKNLPIKKVVSGEYSWDKLGNMGLFALKTGLSYVGGDSGLFSIWSAIQLGYKEIYVHGYQCDRLYDFRVYNDNSWESKEHEYSKLIKEWVDAINMCIENEPRTWERMENDHMMIREFLNETLNMYNEMYSIKWYADCVGAKIYNLTSDSGADCFEKM